MQEEVNLWLIWSIEHNAWWKPGHRGYTPNRAEAGVYPEAEAIAIVENANRHRDPNQPPNEAMIFIKKVTHKVEVLDPLNDPSLPTCRECKKQVTFIEADELQRIEVYSCKCGETRLEKPYIDN